MSKQANPLNLIERSSPEDKSSHIRLCLEKNVESSLTNGFEKYRLISHPLPEINFSDIDISCTFLGKEISAPFIILPMTGGSRFSEKINRNLARAAQELGIVMSVGSQRLGHEFPELTASYQVRDVAPDIPVLANLGAIYLNYGYGLKECEQAVKMINADGLILYLNPLQKIFQGDQHLNFHGLVDKIAYICRNLSVPVIVKEVGFGLSPKAAEMLGEAGVSILDIAGAGGTSWVKITRHMKQNRFGENGACFDDWGIPTADALVAVRKAVKDIPLIASGGIRNGVDIAKALALGASYAGMALPLLEPAMESAEKVKEKIENTLKEFKTAMFCCGAHNIDQLRNGDHICREHSA